MVVNWTIANESCDEAKKNTSAYACKENSICLGFESGYRCTCKDGFQGNPYLSGGCQDVDECRTIKPCNMTCHNFDGGYNCSCPHGYEGDGKKDGSGCFLKKKPKEDPVVVIALGISIALLFLLILTLSLCWVHKQRTLRQLRAKWFEQNGGFLLLERLSKLQRQYYERIKIFKEVELMMATNNFHRSRILGRGGQGVVYKGILPNNQIVAIKKSRMGGADWSRVQDFINEMVVLSQINNRNVVKLLGCCLETEAPILVYEFVSNGNLSDRIDPSKNATPLPWEKRLSIAAETAEAISYLHSVASIPIIHRDIKSSNILLDNNNKAKVSDFGSSRLVPLDETHVSTIVQGTPGYLDPEYLQTSQLNEKSDVYSFGVVLIELLTSEKASQFFGKSDSLVMHFVSSMKEDRLMEILDTRVVNQSNIKQVKEVASLARTCVRVSGEERPTMSEVAVELKGLIAMQRHSSVNEEVKPEEKEYLFSYMASSYGGDGTGTSISAPYGSTQNQMSFELEDGR
ncbi:hypothetical protein L6164_037222 [Bauhinia variegata]|uniref:Uncharacterized protein n=1 Tax=Bauhinia variegata TaxID=167791 RepID=A0ACB9KJG1_BAUVA|nr:hypothetical protein L6164_037222 [Bauhinia variegata]